MTEKVNDTYLIYTCPAFPPEGINPKVKYSYGKDAKGVFIISNGNKRYENEDFFKTFFTPENGKW